MSTPSPRDRRQEARDALDYAERPHLTKVAGGPTVEPSGLGYVGKFPAQGVTIKVAYIKEGRDEFTAEMTILCPSAGTVNGVVEWGRTNLLASRTRGEIAKRLNARVDADWSQLLESFCFEVVTRHRQGAPVEETDPDAPKKGLDYIVKPLLPMGLPTLLYGAGGTGKSTLAAALALSVQSGRSVIEAWPVMHTAPVLILDWEATKEVWQERLGDLARGANLPNGRIAYRACRRRLADDAEEIANIVLDKGIGLIIVDAVNQAVGVSSHEMDPAENALRAFSMMREITGTLVTWLLIDHVTGDNMRESKDGGPPLKAYGCYSDDTEVLTENGWKRHALLLEGERVCAFDLGTGQLRWEVPTEIHRYPYEGPMHRYSSLATECLVTPNHRMVVKPGWSVKRADWPLSLSRDWNFMDSERLPAADWKVPVAGGPIAGEGAVPETWARLLGWWLAEGHLGHRTEIVLTQALGTSVQVAMEATLREAFPRVRTHLDVPRGDRAGDKTLAVMTAVGVPETNEWLRINAGSGARTKRIPTQVFGWPLEARRALLEAMIDGDGCRHGLLRGNGSTAVTYGTSSKQLADDVQRLAILNGLNAIVRYSAGTDSWRVAILSGSETFIRPDRNRRTENYAGDVWCLTVPSGAYVTRLNGIPALQGNSVAKQWLARQQFFLSAEDDAMEDRQELVLRHTKANYSWKLQPQGLVVSRATDSLRIAVSTSLTAPELERQLTLSQRIETALVGPLSLERIRQILEMNEKKADRDQVYNALGKMIKRGTVSKLRDGTYVLGSLMPERYQ
ncbi:MAG: AAA family ATPase [Steroidobacteraceae bacterium]